MLKVWILAIALLYMSQTQEQQRFTISTVAAMSYWYHSTLWGRQLHALTHAQTHGAASRHTTPQSATLGHHPVVHTGLAATHFPSHSTRKSLSRLVMLLASFWHTLMLCTLRYIHWSMSGCDSMIRWWRLAVSLSSNVLVSIGEVTLRRAQLVLDGWPCSGLNSWCGKIYLST